MIKVPGNGEEPLDSDGEDSVEGAGQADLGHRQQERNQHREDLHIFQLISNIFSIRRSSLSGYEPREVGSKF